MHSIKSCTQVTSKFKVVNTAWVVHTGHSNFSQRADTRHCCPGTAGIRAGLSASWAVACPLLNDQFVAMSAMEGESHVQVRARLVVQLLVDARLRGHAHGAAAELQALRRLVRVLRRVGDRDHQARLRVAAQRLLLTYESFAA